MKEIPSIGKILKDTFLVPHGLSVAEAAKKLHMSKNTLGRILYQSYPINRENAFKLAKLFDTSVYFWLDLQQAQDILVNATPEKHNKLQLAKIERCVTRDIATGVESLTTDPELLEYLTPPEDISFSKNQRAHLTDFFKNTKPETANGERTRLIHFIRNNK